MSIHLNDGELDALLGLPDVQVRLYIFGIRRYMDYATGQVGVKRGISWQSLREELAIDPARGRTVKGCPSKDQIRRAALGLQKAGLIRIQSRNMQLIFECLLALGERSVQNKPAIKPPHQTTIEAAPILIDEILENKSDLSSAILKPTTQATIEETGKPAIPLVSGKNNINHTTLPAHAREEAAASTPQTPGEWETLLFQQRGFALHLLKKPMVTQMLAAWCREKVARDDLLAAMAYAEAKLGKTPDSPLYYRRFVEEVVGARKNPKSFNFQPAISTSPSLLRGHHATNQRSFRLSKAEIFFRSCQGGFTETVFDTEFETTLD